MPKQKTKKKSEEFDYQTAARLAAEQLAQHFGVRACKMPTRGPEAWCYSIASSQVSGDTPETRASHFVRRWVDEYSSDDVVVEAVFWHQPDLVFVVH